jgi:hypothetical protein
VAVLVTVAVFVTVLVIVLVRVVMGGGSALTGRVGRHSTTGLAVVAATRLPLAQLDQGVGHGQPQLDRERGVIADPVVEHGVRAGVRPGFLIGR